MEEPFNYTDYEYDMDDDCYFNWTEYASGAVSEPRSWSCYYWDELLPALGVYSLTMLLGVVGNILIIFTTCRYRRMKSTTNVFLASLAAADLLLILICIPVKVRYRSMYRETEISSNLHPTVSFLYYLLR